MIQHLEGDCRQLLPTLPAKSVQCTVTSPPYWGQRSYLELTDPAKHLEIGQETTAKEYIDTLVAIFRQVARVLVNDGTAWLNLGDKYAQAKTARRAGVKGGDLMGLPCALPWRFKPTAGICEAMLFGTSQTPNLKARCATDPRRGTNTCSS